MDVRAGVRIEHHTVLIKDNTEEDVPAGSPSSTENEKEKEETLFIFSIKYR